AQPDRRRRTRRRSPSRGGCGRGGRRCGRYGRIPSARFWSCSWFVLVSGSLSTVVLSPSTLFKSSPHLDRFVTGPGHRNQEVGAHVDGGRARVPVVAGARASVGTFRPRRGLRRALGRRHRRFGRHSGGGASHRHRDVRRFSGGDAVGDHRGRRCQGVDVVSGWGVGFRGNGSEPGPGGGNVGSRPRAGGRASVGAARWLVCGPGSLPALPVPAHRRGTPSGSLSWRECESDYSAAPSTRPISPICTRERWLIVNSAWIASSSCPPALPGKKRDARSPPPSTVGR